MKRPSAPDLQYHPPKKQKLPSCLNFDFELCTKIFSTLNSIFKYGECKFLTGAILAPDDSPLSKAFCSLGPPLISTFQIGIIEKFDISIEGREVVELDGMWEPLNFDLLEKWMKPAPPIVHGEGSSALVHPQGYQIDAEKIKAADLEYHPEIQNLQKMAPQGMCYSLSLVRMHIYKEGDRLDLHVDQCPPNHAAILLVDITPDNNELQGGDFVLHVPEEEAMCFHLRPRASALLSQDEDWGYTSIYFMAHLPWSITPVTRGHRVFLQYDVFTLPTLRDLDEWRQVIKGSLIDNVPNDLILLFQAYHQATDACVNRNKKRTYHRANQDQHHCFYEETQQPVLAQFHDLPTQTDPGILILLLERFTTTNPSTEVCFLLTQNYPISLTIAGLRGADRVLYDTIAPYYEVGIGYAICRIRAAVSSAVKPHMPIPGDITVMTYRDIQAFEASMTDTSQVSWELNCPLVGCSKHDHLCMLFRGNGTQWTTLHAEPEKEPTDYQEGCLGDRVFGTFVLSLGSKRFN